MLASDLIDGHAGIGLLQDRDDLGLRKSGLLHQNLLGDCARKFYFWGVLDMGELTVLRSSSVSR